MQWATAHGYAVFTHDLDFGTMLALTGARRPSIMQVRGLNVLPEAIGSLVLGLLSTYDSEIEQGALLVADERRQRVRILPLVPSGFISSAKFPHPLSERALAAMA